MAYNYNVVCETFDSMEQLLKAVKTREVNDIFKHDSLQSQEKGISSFYGTSSYEEAETLAVNGWNEHLSEMRKGFGGGLSKTQSGERPRRRPTNYVVGFAPNVPNAILGLPDSMVTIHQQPQKVKTITLIYNTSVTSGWKTSQILKSGIAVLRLVNKIEHNGIKVRLISEFKSSIAEKELGIVRVVLKDFKDQLDLKKIAFPFANSAMQRRIGFAWLETVSGLTSRNWVGGYGRSISSHFDHDEVIDILKHYKLLNDNEYYITIPLCYNLCDCKPEKLIEEINIKY